MAKALATLTLDDYAALTLDEYANMSLDDEGGSGGSETTTCLYDATAIAAIKSAVDALATAVASLTNQVNTLQSDITAIKARMPQTGTVSTLTARDVWLYTIYHTGNVESLQSGIGLVEIYDYIINNRLGIATTSNLSGLAKSGDAMTLTTAYDAAKTAAQPSDIPTISNLETVAAAIKAKTDNLPVEPAAKSDVQITVNADGIDVPTVSEIWSHTTRTLTSQIPTVSDIQSGLATATNLSTLQTTANAIKTQTDKIPATAVTPSDITALRTHGDTNWATATGFATPNDVAATDLTQVHSALSLITALLGHWTVSGNVLTTYDDSGSVLKTYALTRDSEGKIISISEA